MVWILLVSGIVGGLCGSVAVLLIAVLQRRRVCAKCGEPQPKLRRPRSTRQALWGGSTCPRCLVELDRRGRVVDPRA